MQLKLNETIKTLTGNPVVIGEKELTLKDACVTALLNMSELDKNITGDEKYKRWKLADKINKEVIDYSVEEVAKIKELTGKCFTTSILGFIWNLLENN